MGLDPFAAEDVEPRVSPALYHPDELPGALPFTQQDIKHAMAEELLQVLHIEPGRDPIHPVAVKTPVRG